MIYGMPWWLALLDLAAGIVFAVGLMLALLKREQIRRGTRR